MTGFFAFLSVVSLLGIILGLIKPTWVLHWGAKRTRLRAVGWYWLFTIVFAIVAGATAPKKQIAVQNAAGQEAPNTSAPVTETPTPAAAPKQDKPAAQAPVADIQPAQPAPAEKTESKIPTYKKGMEATVGNFTYVVDSIKFTKRIGNSMVNATADGVYLLITMTVRNNDSETHSLTSGWFTVKDDSGTEYDYSHNAETTLLMSGGKTFFLKQCKPKIPTKGTLIFEVPKQGVPYFLMVSNGFFSDPVKIALQ